MKITWMTENLHGHIVELFFNKWLILKPISKFIVGLQLLLHEKTFQNEKTTRISFFTHCCHCMGQSMRSAIQKPSSVPLDLKTLIAKVAKADSCLRGHFFHSSCKVSCKVQNRVNKLQSLLCNRNDFECLQKSPYAAEIA